MRLLDESSNSPLTSVLIMLTPEEAHELSSQLRLLEPADGNPDHVDHVHVDDENFTVGITVAIYTSDNLMYFNSRVRELIETGK